MRATHSAPRSPRRSSLAASAGAGVLRRATAVIRGYVDLQTSHSSRSRRPKGRLHLPWAQTSRATGTRNTGGAFASLVRANVPRPLGGASSGAFAGQVSAGRLSMRRQRSRHPADVASRRRRATGELVGPRGKCLRREGPPQAFSNPTDGPAVDAGPGRRSEPEGSGAAQPWASAFTAAPLATAAARATARGRRSTTPWPGETWWADPRKRERRYTFGDRRSLPARLQRRGGSCRSAVFPLHCAGSADSRSRPRRSSAPHTRMLRAGSVRAVWSCTGHRCRVLSLLVALLVSF